MRRTLLLLGCVAMLAWLVPVTAQALCARVPDPTSPYGRRDVCPKANSNVAIFGSTFMPSDVSVLDGGRVNIQNFDQIPHTVTQEACRDADSATACIVDIVVGAGKNLGTAQSFPTGATDHLPAGTYRFFCRNHSIDPESGMRFTLSVL